MEPLAIAIDADSPIPPYEQVRRQIIAAAASGSLPAGTRLPPVRTLAKDVGLAANTVARAYRELEQSGIVQTRGRAGTFVTAGGKVQRERAQRAATAYVDEARSLGMTDQEALAFVEAALAARK